MRTNRSAGLGPGSFSPVPAFLPLLLALICLLLLLAGVLLIGSSS